VVVHDDGQRSMGEFMNLVNQAQTNKKFAEVQTCYIGFELLIRYDAFIKLPCLRKVST